jgi:uncharacterized membrane protein YgdD (TMEM256/DUF423 family)
MTESENGGAAAVGPGEPASAGQGIRGWIAFAALSGAVSVIAGAFAAHGLDLATQADRIGWLRTGSQYEGLHALAMLMTATLSSLGRLQPRAARWAQWLFAAGSVIFPGTLYCLALGGPRWLGAVTPIGGLAFICGWLMLCWAARETGGT